MVSNIWLTINHHSGANDRRAILKPPQGLLLWGPGTPHTKPPLYLACMCVSMQLVIEFDHFGAAANRRILEEVQRLTPYHSASVFDRPAWPVVTAQEPAVVQAMQWGYLPPHAQGDPVKFIAAFGTYNARCENVYTGKLYRDAMEQKLRCLVPVTGFYEHRHVGKLKVPYLIRPTSGGIWWFAGIYQPATRTFSLVTTEANDLMRQIHNSAARQPLILPEGYAQAYLESDFDEKSFTDFAVPLPHQVMQYHTVSKLLTARGVDRNVPEVSAPFTYEGLPPIELAA